MILAQDGHGPGIKIENGTESEYLDGVILSIKNRKPESLPRTVSNLQSKYPDLQIFLDTHFYASQIAMTSPGYIRDYLLYNEGLTRNDFLAVKNIENYARRIVDYQRGLGLTNIILPSLTLNNFNDANSVISLQLYRAATDYLVELREASQTKAYLSLVFQEAALLDNENLSQYLDEITLFQGIAGFYIIVERPNQNFPQWQDSRTLAKLMYIVNTLSNNYEVICGFTDFPGLLLLGAGAKHIASGWHQTLRQYTGSYFMKRRGGQNSTFRYPSKELLTQVISHPDLQNIIKKGFGDKYIDSQYGSGLNDPNNLQISRDEKILLQWKTFHLLGSEVVTATDPIPKLESLIASAENNVAALRSSGIILDRASVNHYEVWKNAIEVYKNGVL